MTVAITLQVMPSSPDEDLGKIKEEIKSIENIKILEIKEQPIAFGIVAIIIVAAVPDEGSDIEQRISNIKGVESIETQSVTLI